MTKIEPITSEEVLARQVREGARETSEEYIDAASNNSNTETGNVSGEGRPLATVSQTIPSQPNTRPAESPKAPDEMIDESGYSYRLPLGSYILSFLYLQISLVAAYSIMTTLLSRSLDMVQSETWGMVTIAVVLSFFIFSGNNVLRKITIGGSTLLILLLGYQLFGSVATYMRFYESSSSALVEVFYAIISTYILALVLEILLLLTTIIYLLRKKVAAAYE